MAMLDRNRLLHTTLLPRLCAVSLLWFLGPYSACAQRPPSPSTVRAAHVGDVDAARTPKAPSTPARRDSSMRGVLREPMRVTTDLLRRPVYENIGRKIEALRHRNARSREDRGDDRPATTLPEIGDTRIFEARNLLDQSEWREVESRLIYRSDRALLWMSKSEYETLRADGHLSSIVDSLSARLDESLPEDALASDFGILEFAHVHLGQPPNVDGDRRLDILLLDIRDDFAETGSHVAGYFDPLHLTSAEHSNRRDMLFVDTRPTLVFNDRLRTDEAAATVAHEYQHLIHAGYEGDAVENTFVNEGLSEVTEIMCGFPPRPADAYFRDPGRPLFSWDYAVPLPDYARASLFTHYLFERIGYRHVDRLVQSTSVGQKGVQSLLKSVGGPPLKTLFREWGQALFAPPNASVYDYRHPDRRDLRFDDVTSVNVLPDVRRLTLPPLSHAPVRFPLVEQVKISRQTRGRNATDIRYSGRSIYPEGGGRFESHLSSRPAQMTADRRPHGSVELLASNVSSRTSPDSTQTAAMLMRGTRSGSRLVRSYDDGVADAYSGSASYLLLNASADGVGLTFGPERTDWLFGISVKVLFSSEIEGTGVPPGVPREVTLRVRRLDDGRPGAPLTPPITRRLDRPFANPRVSFVSLQQWYDELATLRDSFVVTLRSARTDNPLAVALDQTPEPARETAGRAFYTGGQHWQSMRDVRAEGTRLQTFRPILRAHVAVPVRTVSSYQLEADVKRDLEHVFVRLHAPFPLQTDATRVAARLPSGRLIDASPLDHVPDVFEEADTTETFFTLPLEGGDYVIHARSRVRDADLTSVNNTFRWSPSVENGVEVGGVYPNPMRGSEPIRARLLLLDEAQVSVSMYDVQGRLVRKAIRRRAFSRGSHRLRLNTRRLASGTYFVRVTVRRKRDGRTSRTTRKLVVLR